MLILEQELGLIGNCGLFNTYLNKGASDSITIDDIVKARLLELLLES